VPLQSATHNHFPPRIHSNEVKATLAQIHSDCSDTVSMQHCHSLGRSAAVRTIIWIDGTEILLDQGRCMSSPGDRTN
jgi:hypothetical protein